MVAHSPSGSTSSHGNPGDHSDSSHSQHGDDHAGEHAGDHHGADAPDAVFRNAFDSEDQKLLLEEDSEAWYNVTGELLTIVTLGVAFFIFIVWLISR
jgi:hypothetical protein